jgi:hypothetical protein
MPVRIPNNVRCQIVHWFRTLGETIEQIQEKLSNLPGQTFTLSLNWLRQLVPTFENEELAHFWMTKNPVHPGRPRCMRREHVQYVTEHTLATKKRKLRTLRNDTAEMYNEEVPSVSTFYRELKRANISYKVAEHRNILRNEIEGAAWCNRVAWVNPLDWVDIDGTANSKESFNCRRGRSKVGEPCILPQIRIGNKCYSTMASCTPDGFLVWQVYDIPVTSEMFCEYLTEKVQPLIHPGRTVCMLDNASIHKTDIAIETLEDIFHGRFYYSPKYSPNFKPIELCFKLVKEHIRDNEQEALADPVGFINRTFELFAIGGERAGSVRGCWNQYFHLHANYLA